MSDTIKFNIDIGNIVEISVFVNGVKLDLHLNPEMIFKPLENNKVDLLLPSGKEGFSQRVSLSHDEETVSWIFPDDKNYFNAAGQSYIFDIQDYIDECQSVLFEVVKRTTILTGIDRKSIKVGNGNLKDFLAHNKENIKLLLAIEQ